MDYQPLTPDAEVFARVWSRVMPDAEAGPIALNRPGQQPQPPQPQPGPPTPRGDEEILRQLLEQMDTGLAGGMELARRDRRAAPILESLRRSARQLRTAWFLLTGQRWREGPPPRGGREELPALIRRQYRWEVGFSGQCQQAGHTLRGEDLRELMPGLEAASVGRRGMLRRLAEG